MNKTKGCINQNCSAKRKKIKYKANDSYCSKCGQELTFVCPKCYTVLNKINGKYCIRCSESQKDKKEKNAKILGGVVAGLGSVAGAIGLAIKMKKK